MAHYVAKPSFCLNSLRTNYLIRILKPPTSPYSCLAKVLDCHDLSKCMVHNLQAHEKCPFSNCSDLIASHCVRCGMVRQALCVPQRTLEAQSVPQRCTVQGYMKFHILMLCLLLLLLFIILFIMSAGEEYQVWKR